MSEQTMQDEIIPNGEEIVERFGGIRPMAAKLGVPVTTVQGWKKRDAIPAIRRDEIVSAASLHNIDLSGLVPDGFANENTRPEGRISDDPALAGPGAATAQTIRRSPRGSSDSLGAGVDLSHVRRSARTTSIVTSAIVSAVLIGAGWTIFGTGPSRQHVNALENRVSSLENNGGSKSSIDLESLRRSFGSLQTQVGKLAATVGDDGGTPLSRRIAQIETQLRALGGGTGVAVLADRLQTQVQSPEGRAEWQAALDQLRGVVTDLQGRTGTLESALSQAQGNNDALGRTLSDVSGRDLSAAAMLLVLTQLRDSTDRETPFADDLAILRAVANETDSALAASVDKLAPYAENGILSPAGLKRELMASANDIITARLKGENVSIKDKVMARLQGLFSLKRDGVPVSGSAEQALIEKASAQLDAHDVAGAMATLRQLQGPAAQAAAPWQQKAEGTLQAQQLDAQLVSALITKLKNGLGAPRVINLAPQTPPSAPSRAPAAQVQPQAAPQAAPGSIAPDAGTPQADLPSMPAPDTPESSNAGVTIQQ